MKDCGRNPQTPSRPEMLDEISELDEGETLRLEHLLWGGRLEDASNDQLIDDRLD